MTFEPGAPGVPPLDATGRPLAPLPYPVTPEAKRAGREEFRRAVAAKRRQIREMSPEELSELRAAGQRAAGEVPARVRARLVLPELSGSGRQVASASGIRDRRIDFALSYTRGDRYGGICYAIGDALTDPLATRFIPRLDPPGHRYAGEDELVTAVMTALHHRTITRDGVLLEDRTTAAWWIWYNQQRP